MSDPTAQRTAAETPPDRETAMLEIARALNASLTLKTALARVLELVLTGIDADAASVFVRAEEDQDELEVSFARRGGAVEQASVSQALGLSGHVLKTGESVQVADVREEPRFEGKLDNRFGTRTRSLMAVPMRRREDLAGLMEVLREEPRPFEPADLEFLQAVADELAVAVENARLVERLQWELEVREVLLEAARKVGSSLDMEEVLDHLLSLLARLIPYDAAGIYLLDTDTGGLVKVEHRGYPPGTEEILKDRPGTGITGWVASHRRSLNVGRVEDDPRYLEARSSTRSEIAVPVIWADQVIGVITLESDEPDAYTDRQVSLLEMIAGQVASAITNARLYEERVERARIEHELGLSREIQCGLFPDERLDQERVEAFGINVSSSAVGGDYYDHFAECEHHAMLAIADVSGHGLSASLLMSAVRGGVHMSRGAHPNPARLAAQLNGLLYDSTPANQYVAAVLALLDTGTGTLHYCNAGHVPPVWLHEDEERLLEGGGLILGSFPDSAYEVRHLTLEPGDLLAFYTDGLTEMENAAGEEFGRARLTAALRELRTRPLEEIMQEVRRRARRHRSGAERIDDVTLMLVRWKG